jgi:hypothetical protein
VWSFLTEAAVAKYSLSGSRYQVDPVVGNAVLAMAREINELVF